MHADTSWIGLGACQTAEPEIFFPIGEGSPHRNDAALRYCRRCPVREECLHYALRVPHTHGIWGGTDEEERRMIRMRH